MTTTDLRPVSSAAAKAGATPTSPLLAGPPWYDALGRSCILRMEVPLTAGEMVAALYGEHHRLHERDLEDDIDVWMRVAVVVVQDGADRVEQLADQLADQEQAGTLAAPDWLAICRRRVAEVIGEHWSTAKHRCPCGYASDDVTAFDAHLKETGGMQPEHFEVVDGWTLEQVLGWHTPGPTTGGFDIGADGCGATVTGEAKPAQSPGAASAAAVTDVPAEDVTWFMEHGLAEGAAQAEELAPAELTAKRDGYVIRWVRPWVCQIREPDDEKLDGLITSADGVILDGTPNTDPRARQVEQRLLQEAGLCGDGETTRLPSSERCDGDHRILRRYAGYHVFWEQVWVCQLFEPDSTTLISQSDGLSVDPYTHPHGRAFAAHLLLEAGV